MIEGQIELKQHMQEAAEILLPSMAKVLSAYFAAEAIEKEAAQEICLSMKDMNLRSFEKYGKDYEQLVYDWNKSVEQAFMWPNLEESVYSAWTKDRTHPLYNVKGLAYGDCAVHMGILLKHSEISLNGLAPDHLSIRLQFLTGLLMTRSMQEAAQFCSDHLSCIDDIKRVANEKLPSEFLIFMLEAAQKLVEVVLQPLHKGDNYGQSRN